MICWVKAGFIVPNAVTDAASAASAEATASAQSQLAVASKQKWFGQLRHIFQLLYH